MKILITGGHLTPALSFIDYLKTQTPQPEIIFVGRQYSQITTQQLSQEPAEIQKRGIPFIEFESGRWQLHSLVELWQEPLLFIKAFFKAKKILKEHKPDVIVTFGGHLGVPIALAAKMARIPTILHEQTHVVGMASRVIALVATKIAVSRDLINVQFSNQKSIYTGNLLRNIFFTETPTQPEWITYDLDVPILYVTGGNQGSQFINDLVKNSLSDLTQRWIVIHQSGKASQQYNPKEDLERAALGLPALFKSRYFVREWISESELVWILSQARAALTRSGANTVDELELFSVPAVFIPLPKSHFGEQNNNAQEAVDRKGGIILPQDQATPETLKVALAELTQSFPRGLTTVEDRKTKDIYHSPERLLAIITQTLSSRAK